MGKLTSSDHNEQIVIDELHLYVAVHLPKGKGKQRVYVAITKTKPWSVTGTGSSKHACWVRLEKDKAISSGQTTNRKQTDR